MFCPNCGNDCGVAKFCVKCGTKIEQAEKEAAWSVGMPCPHCGGTKLDGNNCAFCGTQLLQNEILGEREKLEIDSFEIPVGRYQYFSNSLILEPDAFVIYKKRFLSAAKVRIPYSDLTAMMYVRPAEAAFAPGYIVFRWKGNTAPLPAEESCANDKASIKFSSAQDFLFYHLFWLIRSQGPSSIRTVTKNITTDQETISDMIKKYGLDTYFERFNPYRERATQALCEETSLTEAEAKTVISNMFDIYQGRLYRSTPHVAVRDANRAIREHRRIIADRQKNNQEQLHKERMMQLYGRME